MRLSRRKFVTMLAGTAIVGSWPLRPTIVQAKEWSLEDFTKNIQSGGPPKDGIPPIDKPKYIQAAEAERFLKSTDVVFGLAHQGVIKAYPQKILVWHEIVNDDVNGEKIAITYCPLTGSAVGFRGPRDATILTFGTSGMLVNSNLLMYDRQTDSQWPQILGVAIDGKSKGRLLDEISLAWTQWSRWRVRHPETLVLSTDTGHLRTYGRDPYGSYDQSGTYYDSGGPLFPVMAKNNRFSPKEVVIGVKANGQQVAIHKQALREKRVSHTTLAGLPLVALYDENLDVVRVFVSRVGEKSVTFASRGGRVVDELTGSQWTSEGRAVSGKAAGTQLKQQASFDVMWFAWYAFFPSTHVLA